MKNLVNLENKFIEQLEKATFVYKIIGRSTKESPMWLQLRHLENEDVLIFRSSQSNVWMSISCTPEEMKTIYHQSQEAYDYFKYLKYTYLKNNHPTVWNELSPSWLSTIESFLEDYSFYNL